MHLICVRFDHMICAHVSRVLVLLLQYRLAFDVGASAFPALDKFAIFSYSRKCSGYTSVYT
jgi:hypothetical protein